jgi:hypothetical protein
VFIAGLLYGLQVTQATGRDSGRRSGQALHALQAHLLVRPPREGLCTEVPHFGGEVGDLALELGEALCHGGHQMPASASGSISAR